MGGALVFATALALVAFAYFYTKKTHTKQTGRLYILTRPLGATLGDMLTELHENGGLDLSRISPSLVIAAVMIIGIFLTAQRQADIRRRQRRVCPDQREDGKQAFRRSAGAARCWYSVGAVVFFNCGYDGGS